MLRTNKLFIILLLLAFTLSSIVIQHEENPQGSNIQGSYRLRLPKVPFTIDNGILSFFLCNTHSFRIYCGTAPNQIQFMYDGSTKKACPDNFDEDYIPLFNSITSYKLDSTKLDLFKDGESIAFATRQFTEQNKESINGKWQLELENLPLTVNSTIFNYKGCNFHRLGYKKDGTSIHFDDTPASTKIYCNIENDIIFSEPLIRGKIIRFGELKFELYTIEGELTAYATPYVN